MSVVAVIPARGGSKRLPRKNIIEIAGKPILSHVIENCLEAQLFDEVVVSTEDEKIASIAQSAGAIVHIRDLILADDEASVDQVCKDVVVNHVCDIFCCVYATAALITPKTLNDSFNAFRATPNAETLLGVSSYNFPPVQALAIKSDGYAYSLMPEYTKIKSQQHPKTRVSNGTFCWARTLSFLKNPTFYSRSLRVYDVPDEQVCDLDTELDLQKLKLKMVAKN